MRIGKSITIQYSVVDEDASTGASAAIVCTAIPARFLPTADVTVFSQFVLENNIVLAGYCLINSTGIQWKTGTGTNFTASAHTGLLGGTLTYVYA